MSSCFLPSSSPAAGDGQNKRIIQKGPVRLTEYASGLGCACKLRPQALEDVLKSLPRTSVVDSNLLVGNETSDDAVVYRLNEEQALVSTVDFFPPVVDDPFLFGQISAANALSDVYAMGGVPVSALSIVGFPSSVLSLDILSTILAGAQRKAEEAGIIIGGGHTIDSDLKFGLSVSGIVHPNKLFRNCGVVEGDVLVLTKPIGTGMITTALKKGFEVSPELTSDVFASMSLLNRSAMEVLTSKRFFDDVHAVTDVTGFGLLGHLSEMVGGTAGSYRARVFGFEVPFFDVNLIQRRQLSVISGGTVNNSIHVSGVVRYAADVPQWMRMLLCDAQTSGGLLFSIRAEREHDVLRELRSVGLTNSRCIGFIESGTEDCRIVVENEWRNENAPSGEEFSISLPSRLPMTTDTLVVPRMDPGLTFFYRSGFMGSGDVVLGRILLQGHFLKLADVSNRRVLPWRLIFVGESVQICSGDLLQGALPHLRELELLGVTIWSCKTCTDKYGTTGKIVVGRICTADEVTDALSESDRVRTI